MKLDKYKLITAGLVGITACSGLILTSVRSYADNDSAVDDVNITVPVSCTMTGTIATGSEHTATLQPGTYSGASGSDYENGIGKTTLTTFCNDFNGFSIYAIGFTGETDGDNTLVGTSASSSATIPTKVYESTDTTSNWSMKVTKVTDSTTTFNPANMTISNSFDSWHTVPDDYTKVAEYHASTGSSATDTSLGAKVETTYASYISTTQPADTYTGKVKYVMVHPYDGTAPESPSSDTSFEDAYAAAGKQKLNSYYQMQDMTSGICSAVTLQDDASETTLIDSRDNKIYTVSKLADGNCWMTQNLDHDIDSSFAYSSSNTDIPANWEETLEDTYVTNDETWNQSSYSPESYDPGDLCWNGIIDDSGYGGNLEDWATECGNDKHYHLGNYYNWTAAIAMEDSSEAAYSEEDANQSICPAGWRLPKGGVNYTGSGSFTYMINELGLTGDVIHQSPVYYSFAGTWEGSSNYIGGIGSYWTSVYSNDANAYILYFNKNGYLEADESSVTDVGYGNPVRCIAR